MMAGHAICGARRASCRPCSAAKASRRGQCFFPERSRSTGWQDLPRRQKCLYADKTAAWGWRGIVHTESHSVIAHDIPIRDIQGRPAGTAGLGLRRKPGAVWRTRRRGQRRREIAATVRGWVAGFLETCSDSCRLSDLYQTLLPRFYALLLGEPPRDFQTTASTALFRFNTRDLCACPGSRLVGLFLDPKRGHVAREAYNRAVGRARGSTPLDAFGPGAIPFDLVIPGVGRGTIRLARRLW